MPTNLPPEYFEAERKFKEASNPIEKAAALEELLGTIPKHKGTDKLRAEYRKKLSKLKSQAQQSKKTGKHESNFHIEKEGAARVVVIGAPNSGKSSLITSLTNAKPEVSNYPYTTWLPTPGMMEFLNINLQLIDTPPLNKEHVEPDLFELIKTADIILLMIAVNESPLEMLDDCIDILIEHHIAPSSEMIEYKEDRMKFIPFVIAINKVETKEDEEEFDVLNELLRSEWLLVPISIKENHNIDRLFDIIIREMELIRVYSKPPGEDVDKSQPFILKRGSTVETFASKVHKDFLMNFKSARIWGKDVFDGQQVGRNHLLNDGDVVELHL